MSIDRRKFLSNTMAAGAGISIMNSSLFAQEEAPRRKNKHRFLLYIHFGSSCGIANGLVQPGLNGKWPKGFFESGVDGISTNPLLNRMTKAGSLFLHDYMSFLAPMAEHMCLINGNAKSLDHNVAILQQKRGSGSSSASPEWAMGFTQNMKHSDDQNPMVITKGNKSSSVPDVTSVFAGTVTQFQQMTKDVSHFPGSITPILDVLKKRFDRPGLGSVVVDESLSTNAAYQLKTLQVGLPELEKEMASIESLTAALAWDNRAKLVTNCMDKTEITVDIKEDSNFRDKLILAGILAKTGLSHGMTIDAMTEDRHLGGSDVQSARLSSAKWTGIKVLWDWIVAQNLQEDVMIVVGQEFARSAYTKKAVASQYQVNVPTAAGSTTPVTAWGREHSLAMGMMFINANVPAKGRIGMIGDGLTPLASIDAKGTIDLKKPAYNSQSMVGSMLMRVFPDLFPSARMVSKHWSGFSEIDATKA